MKKVLTGLDNLHIKVWKNLKGYRLGLLANQASLDSRLNPARDIISELLPGQLKVIFGPQHGYGGQDQDNMQETDHTQDNKLGIPVFSLYSEAREPMPYMLEEIDILVIDLQDVGTRVYTFASTMLNCLRAMAERGKKVLILDRPNPLGGEVVEGNILRSELYSFVGPYKIPMRHGLTMGELALLFNKVFALDCDLEIIPLTDWNRKMLWNDTGLKWLMPSVNMPLPETAFVYPGQVIWEGTNLSEGRGTCRPFEIFGAPFLDPDAILKNLQCEAVKGCILREYLFIPTFNKWKGKLCRGFMIHIIDPQQYRPYLTSLAILQVIIKLYPDDFAWTRPPYEYEYIKKPIDLIIGDADIRSKLEKGNSITEIKRGWKSELEAYIEWRKPFLLYQ